jgi:OmpA family protein
MRSVVGPFIVVTMLVGSVASGIAAGPYVYPQKGQSPDQQKRDSYECYDWAKKQSGVDPGQPPPPAPPGQHAGGTVRGAGRGAAGGAAIGAIAGDAGKGAAAGAVVGGVRGRRQSKAASQQQQAATQDSYNRAFAACMDGRGYSVR